METVKVDIQKLQLLNDRIAQTIEALNQVRMSVQVSQQPHGTTSPWGFTPNYGFVPTAFGGQPSFQSGFQPGYGTPYNAPYVVTPFTGAPAYASIQHTSPTVIPQQTFVPQHTTGLTGWTTPWLNNGISHSTWDPTLQMRALQQTLPFVQYPWY